MYCISRANERSLAELVGINPNELRRYMGMLLVHRLVKRYVTSLPHYNMRIQENVVYLVV